jgi:tetratricopeptide (TPR) repeat protein
MRSFFYLLAPVLILAGVYIFKQNQAKPQFRTTPTVKINRNREIFLGKRKPIAAKTTVAAAPQVVCTELTRALSDLDFSGSVNDFSGLIREEDLRGCQAKEYAADISAVLKNCYGTNPSPPDCQKNLLYLRSALRTQNLESADDQETIADLLIKNFYAKEMNMQKVSELSEKLLDIDPGNQPVQKLWAMSKFLAQKDMTNLPEGFQEEILAKVDPEVAESGEFRTYQIIMETGLDPVRAEEEARYFVEDYPEQAESHEILGWSLWHQGRREEALQEVRQAVQLAPQDQALQTMYQALLDPRATRETYTGRINMGIQLEDLYD